MKRHIQKGINLLLCGGIFNYLNYFFQVYYVFMHKELYGNVSTLYLSVVLALSSVMGVIAIYTQIKLKDQKNQGEIKNHSIFFTSLHLVGFIFLFLIARYQLPIVIFSGVLLYTQFTYEMSNFELRNMLLILSNQNDTSHQTFHYFQIVIDVCYAIGIFCIGLFVNIFDMQYMFIISIVLNACYIGVLFILKSHYQKYLNQNLQIQCEENETLTRKSIFQYKYVIITVIFIFILIGSEDAVSSFVLSQIPSGTVLFGWENLVIMFISVTVLFVTSKLKLKTMTNIKFGLCFVIITYLLMLWMNHYVTQTSTISIPLFLLCCISTGLGFSIIYANSTLFVQKYTSLNSIGVIALGAILDKIGTMISPLIILNTFQHQFIITLIILISAICIMFYKLQFKDKKKEGVLHERTID